MIIYDGKEWKAPRYKITRQYVWSPAVYGWIETA